MNQPQKKSPIHPGIYIKQSLLPNELSVKEAAEMLDISRPALSNLLNGRAALSSDMAMRVEKAFQANAAELLEMQARYDEVQARARADDIAVRAYAPAYLQITAHQIESWADTIRAREQLPALLRTLVHSTGTNLTAVNFPAFDNSQRYGWDGQVTSGSATPWIPRGESGWEFGCNAIPQQKAERDYLNRTTDVNVPAKERKSTTFVFVTPRNWHGKDSWAKDKRNLGKWKDVRAFDASDLEQWLEQSIPAQTRMREFQRGAAQGIVTLGHVWREWAGATGPELPKALFAPAVQQHKEGLEAWLKAPPTRPFVVTADSTLEALAFLNCALGQLGDSCPGSYERTIVIRSLEAFRNIPHLSSKFVALVASSEVEESLAGFQRNTHTIIVRGRNMVMDDPDVALDLLGHEPFRKALSDIGFSHSRIEQLSRESARSPTILRRRLAQVQAVKIPSWATDDSIARALIPLVFVGAWDSSTEADRDILHCLSEISHEDTERRIAELQARDEPPVWSIGHFRGIGSKVDALYAIHRNFTRKDLENFLCAAEIVLSEEDPALELPPDKRWAANLYGRSREHSPTLRRGLCDTLVLLAVHGNALFGERLGIDLEHRVSKVVNSLLNPSAVSTWLSQKNDLPQYAEAAPDTFLSIVEADLNSDAPQIDALFASPGNGIFEGCPRTELLWALELLAWQPERVVRVASVLAKLCAWKIDDNWANTPMASLGSIFHCWMPQTAASVDQRKRALQTLTNTFPDVSWQICIGQISGNLGIGLFSMKPRWRTDAYDAGEVTTGEEPHISRRWALKLALDWSAHDAGTLGDLVEQINVLSPEYRNRVWELVAAWNATDPPDAKKAELRERIRDHALIRRSRRHNIDDATRGKAQEIYQLLKPGSLVMRHQWLFLKEWIQESLGEIEAENYDYKQRDEQIASQRRDALQQVFAESGLEGIKELCRSGEASHVVGRHMAEVCVELQEAANFLHGIMAENSHDLLDKCDQCIGGFLAKLDVPDRDGVVAELLARLGSDESASIRLLRCAPFDSNTWQHVDKLQKHLKCRYWNEVHPRGGHHEASATATFVDQLLEVDRPRAAFFAAHLDWQLLDSPRLIRLLNEVATNEAEPHDHYRVKGYHISKALDTLEQRGDTSRGDLARLEFVFIDALDHSEHGIRNLEAQLSENPDLFMHALALTFKRNDIGEDPPEWRPPSSESRTALAHAAYRLLTSASRIPGTQTDASIDQEKLREWVKQARTLAHKYGRAEMGDQMIGQLLSRCEHDDDGVWPCEYVRDVLDDVGSEEMAIGMSIGIRNARGETPRDEPGTPEHALAEKYRIWSREVAFEHPFTARMLDKTADSYERIAKDWDNERRVRYRLEE